jgi:hypothetical protein
MISRTSFGSSRNGCARARIGACSLRMPSITGCLQSRQPIPALRQPCSTHAWQVSSEYTWCNCQTGQLAGSPGSVRRMRAGSVGIRRILCVTEAASSRSVIVLP